MESLTVAPDRLPGESLIGLTVESLLQLGQKGSEGVEVSLSHSDPGYDEMIRRGVGVGRNSCFINEHVHVFILDGSFSEAA